MTNKEKLMKAAEIFKTRFPGATGFRLYISDSNANVVDFMGEDGLYCSINVRSGAVKGI